jgi:hypothetical protein
VAHGSAGEPDVAGVAAIWGQVREPVDGFRLKELLESAAVHPHSGELGVAWLRGEGFRVQVEPFPVRADTVEEVERGVVLGDAGGRSTVQGSPVDVAVVG